MARADEAPLRTHEVPPDAPHAGQAAPLFSLPDADMETVDLGQFRGKKHVVLYFYPKDGTPGCTLEATDFSDHEDEFSRCNCVVIGVSPDDCLSHAGFRDQNGVSIRLLADTESEVCRKYGVVHEKEANGSVKSCITRSTFIIDKEGTVRHVFYGVNPRGHAVQVLGLVKSLR
ncbi:MAG TPA: peroxiredoxin [Burkholderiales bacterium]|nr:peroxiredoxin [Burkholderiales bacterium]